MNADKNMHPAPGAQGRTVPSRLEPDTVEIGRFADAMFRHADPDCYASLRVFGNNGGSAKAIVACDADNRRAVVEGVAKLARQYARQGVVCPPVATFRGRDKATEADLVNGLALSVECDRDPEAARARLEHLLGPATVVVASGGEWTDPATREVQDKLHLHWRLTEPTREAGNHAALKRARALAAELVGGDTTNKPAVHPIRWPGTWHSKNPAEPRLCRIVAEGEHEIELGEALERLEEAAKGARPNGSGDAAGHGLNGSAGHGTGEARSMAELVRAIVTGQEYHGPTTALAMRYLKTGVLDPQAVETLRSFMLAVPEPLRDGGHPGRWQARYDEIPRAVRTARAKLGPARASNNANTGEAEPVEGWPEPVDFLADAEATGDPELKPEHLPAALAPFVFDTASRLGVDPATVALSALVALASAMDDRWAIQPKQHDTTWTENPRIWGAIVGDPSVMKTPVLKATTSPLETFEKTARDKYAKRMRAHLAAMQTWKDAPKATRGKEPIPPTLDRYVVEGSTVEALSEVLRTDSNATQRAPMRKVLVRQDEMAEWIGGFDRYAAGGRGGADRGAYLRLYNGGQYSIDRVGRGPVFIENWSACILGGIQPGPIQRIAADAVEDGLLQRFCYAVPGANRHGEDRAPDEKAAAAYRNLFQTIAPMKPDRVALSAEAQEVRREVEALAWGLAAMPDTSGRMKAALGKWPGLFARMCLIFHVIECASRPALEMLAMLSGPIARAAASYLRDVLLPHLVRADAIMFATVQTEHAKWVAGYILSRGITRLARRDLVQDYRPLRRPEDARTLDAVLAGLEAAGWVRAEERKNQARGAAAWHVNPRVHSLFPERAEAERERRAGERDRVAEAVRLRSEAKGQGGTA